MGRSPTAMAAAELAVLPRAEIWRPPAAQKMDVWNIPSRAPAMTRSHATFSTVYSPGETEFETGCIWPTNLVGGGPWLVCASMLRRVFGRQHTGSLRSICFSMKRRCKLSSGFLVEQLGVGAVNPIPQPTRSPP